MTLHPQARAYLEAMGEPDEMSAETVAAVRAEMRAAVPPSADRVAVEHVADVDAGGVPSRLYRPREGAPVALYVHGGGWVLHDLETHDAFCRYLSDATGFALLSVGYRLAPEHPYPAPLDDVEAAARWLRSNGASLGVDASWLPAIGDSSGGNLVAGLAVRDPRAVDLQVLVYPATDRRALLADEDNAALDRGGMDWFWEAYAPGELGDQPEVSPLRAVHAGLPPALVVTAEHDSLRTQGEAYATALAEAGVAVTAQRVLGQVHGFWRQPAVFDASRDTVAMVAGFLEAHRP
ncbi:alpha/beta hydrolase [Aeromicrobium sp. Leaf350]|uniref:alpha/beta hydrolase n=1 Tax=Aeromicrobium sp. Leaf350 TaxID=2876565 RepID=UPI001E5C0B43|nr:alpha/beta hydrolase [Aeromicrobium sp. Leaf350]